MGAHENVHAVDLKHAEPSYALAQLRRADSLAATHRVEALRRKRDATSLGGGEFRLQGRSPIDPQYRFLDLTNRIKPTSANVTPLPSQIAGASRNAP